MTLEEKVALLHALWQQKASISDEQGNFSPEKAETVQHGMGRSRDRARRRALAMVEFTNTIPQLPVFYNHSHW